MSQMRRIDLNSDLGEGFGPWSIGDDAAMMDLATSANVACGGHAGDPETMFVTLSFATQRGTARRRLERTSYSPNETIGFSLSPTFCATPAV
jgi:hypothetical protein